MRTDRVLDLKTFHGINEAEFPLKGAKEAIYHEQRDQKNDILVAYIN